MASDLTYITEIRDLFDAVVKIYQGWGTTHARDMKVEMSRIYTRLQYYNDRPDFSDSRMRWIYLYSYLPRHVHLVYAALSILTRGNNEEIDILETLKGQPIVCSIGGGPNIDALGLSLYLRVSGHSDDYLPFQKVNVFDQCVQWGETWGELKEKVPPQYKHDVKYHEFDYKKTISDDYMRIIGTADIITMIKVLSSVVAWRDQVLPNVRAILRNMKPGALLLYIDNINCPATRLLEDAVNMPNEYTHRFLIIWNLVDVKLTNEVFSAFAKDLNEAINHFPALSAGEHEMVLIKRLH